MGKGPTNGVECDLEISELVGPGAEKSLLLLQSDLPKDSWAVMNHTHKETYVCVEGQLIDAQE
jgi:hypothetical protein